jgi:hypothetical protein
MTDTAERDRIAADALRWAAQQIDPGPRNSRPTPADRQDATIQAANRGTATWLRFMADQVERGYVEPRPVPEHTHDHEGATP